MTIRTATDLGLLIRQERRRQGLDQKSLATRVGVSRQWLIEIEKGKPGAPVGLVLRTLNVLGIGLRDAALVESPVDIDAVVDRARGRARRGRVGR